VSNTIIQNTVEFIGDTGKTMGTLMPRFGGMQPMVRAGGFGGGTLQSDSRQQRINKHFRIID
jgi:hypothetical protein